MIREQRQVPSSQDAVDEAARGADAPGRRLRPARARRAGAEVRLRSDAPLVGGRRARSGRAPRGASPGVQRGTVTRGGERLRRGGRLRPHRRRPAPLGAAPRHAQGRRARPVAPALAGLIALAVALVARLRRRLGLRAADAAARAGGRAHRVRATSTSRSRITAATRSASSRGRSTGCACSSPASTTPAASSSPTPRTSCGRRSSRSAASSSCFRDEELDEATRARVPRDDDRAGDAALEARHRPARPLAPRRGPAADRGGAGRARGGRRRPARGVRGRRAAARPAARGGRARAAASPLGDEERVLQIGRALVENALLHTPPGTRPVRIVAAAAATLRVEDEGPAIPADQQERVFARFSRLDGSRASGSGLGLAIARGARTCAWAATSSSSPGRAGRCSRSCCPDGVFTGKRAAGYSPLSARSPSSRSSAPPSAPPPRSASAGRRARRRRTTTKTVVVREPAPGGEHRRPSVRTIAPAGATGFVARVDLRPPLAGRRHVFSYFGGTAAPGLGLRRLAGRARS